jgi:hypothetical protein
MVPSPKTIVTENSEVHKTKLKSGRMWASAYSADFAVGKTGMELDFENQTTNGLYIGYHSMRSVVIAERFGAGKPHGDANELLF